MKQKPESSVVGRWLDASEIARKLVETEDQSYTTSLSPTVAPVSLPSPPTSNYCIQTIGYSFSLCLILLPRIKRKANVLLYFATTVPSTQSTVEECQQPLVSKRKMFPRM